MRLTPADGTAPAAARAAAESATADDLEAGVHAAVRAGDVDAVQSLMVALALRDPTRAQLLLSQLSLAVRLRSELGRDGAAAVADALGAVGSTPAAAGDLGAHAAVGIARRALVDGSDPTAALQRIAALGGGEGQ